MNKPLASVSLDLDNQWSYMKTHGDAGWEKFPSYFETVVPQLLDFLDRKSLKITFFVIGQDAALEKNRNSLKLLTDRGHEVGNHSFHHQQWLHLYSKDQLRQEVLKAEENIFHVTGEKPTGFRGPGFSWSPSLLEILAENNYLYDATTFPTYIGPLAKLYYLAISNLSKKEKKEVKEIFGSFKEGLRSIKPYRWQLASGKTLIEIPVTTMPVIKIPFHMSYLLYLSRISSFSMFAYLSFALFLCKMTKTGPNFLLHPTDFIDQSMVPELAFFPGMKIEKGRKIALVEKALEIIGDRFDLVKLNTFAKTLLQNKDIRTSIPYRKHKTAKAPQ